MSKKNKMLLKLNKIIASHAFRTNYSPTQKLTPCKMPTSAPLFPWATCLTVIKATHPQASFVSKQLCTVYNTMQQILCSQILRPASLTQ
jgi:hypothetical protein